MSEDKTRKRYPRDFKLEAVKMVKEQGASKIEVCRNLGIAKSSLELWIKNFSQFGIESFPGSGNLISSDEKVRKLERDLRRVTQERDILKKAIAYFTETPK